MSSSKLRGLQYLFSLFSLVGEDIEHMLLLVGKGIEWSIQRTAYIYIHTLSCQDMQRKAAL